MAKGESKEPKNQKFLIIGNHKSEVPTITKQYSHITLKCTEKTVGHKMEKQLDG
jgi:hypothetical protein